MGNIVPLIPSDISYITGSSSSMVACYNAAGQKISHDFKKEPLPVCEYILLAYDKNRPCIVLREQKDTPRAYMQTAKKWLLGVPEDVRNQSPKELNMIDKCGKGFVAIRFEIFFLAPDTKQASFSALGAESAIHVPDDYFVQAVKACEKVQSDNHDVPSHMGQTVLGKAANGRKESTFVDVVFISHKATHSDNMSWYCPWIVLSGPTIFLNGAEGTIPLCYFPQNIATNHPVKVAHIPVQRVTYHGFAFRSADTDYEKTRFVLKEPQSSIALRASMFEPDIVNSISFYMMKQGLISPIAIKAIVGLVWATNDDGSYGNRDIWSMIEALNEALMNDAFYLIQRLFKGAFGDDRMMAEVEKIARKDLHPRENIDITVDFAYAMDAIDTKYAPAANCPFFSAWKTTVIDVIHPRMAYFLLLAQPGLFVNADATGRKRYMDACFFFWDYAIRVKRSVPGKASYTRERGSHYLTLLLLRVAIRLFSMSTTSVHHKTMETSTFAFESIPLVDPDLDADEFGPDVLSLLPPLEL